MKKKVYKVMNLLLGSVVTMLGFESCSDDNPFNGGEMPVEYGSPHATYRLIGTVTDENGNPIEGIKVKVVEDTSEYGGGVYEFTNGTTDGKGKFKTGEAVLSFLSEEEKVVFVDEDGPANGGTFASDTLKLKDLPKGQYAKAPNDDHWSSGSFELTADVKLKKEEK